MLLRANKILTSGRLLAQQWAKPLCSRQLLCLRQSSLCYSYTTISMLHHGKNLVDSVQHFWLWLSRQISSASFIQNFMLIHIPQRIYDNELRVLPSPLICSSIQCPAVVCASGSRRIVISRRSLLLRGASSCETCSSNSLAIEFARVSVRSSPC